ncbi:hypothetical protein EIL87_07945 [Saccharopolyspora rhizosphaerae]|uniref:Uncharacterized protein n=1 Tax=Saccharopolyspora rhizosphaerae TaxID=2492662 RepID=A0A426JYE1_9PSEU|nr:hypothetical protein [Saccharopolyspora rhizosphaerae]RRO18169.1 hypothetical protein EIL87_07945 [Saccharopolyspora rhizosphaerae]
MSKDLANDIALWIFVPSLVFFAVVTVATALGTPRGVRASRRARQLAQLEQVAEEQRTRQQAVEIDWLEYRELPMPEIIELLRKYGWAYRDDELGKKAWLLRFDLISAGKQANAGQG